VSGLLKFEKMATASRPRNENIYMINEAEYNALQKEKNNAEYLAMLDRGFKEIDNGSKGMTKTM